MALSDDELLQVVDNEIDLSKELIFNQVARERSYAYDLYYRKPLGNEVEGRSTMVTGDVAMAIDTTVPALMEMFVASDKAVEFQPRKAEDVKGSEQATDLANYYFYARNRGYQLVYDALWDGLAQKTGALKWYWETSYSVVEEMYQGLNEQQFVLLTQDPEMEVVAHNSYVLDAGTGPQAYHDVAVKRKKETGCVKICSIPVDEFLLSPKARGYDLYEAPFVAHCPLLTQSELLELGVPQEILDEVGDGDDLIDSENEVTRYERLGILDRRDDTPDPSQRRYRYYECYLKVDYDQDGIAELRKVCKVGSRIVHNDTVDHIPMSYWTPKTMPHEPIGMSMADDAADIQLLNTTLWRAGLDALYLTIAPRTVVDVEANANLPTLDDLLTVRPGGVIRARVGTIAPLVDKPADLSAISGMIEFARQEGDQRTGAYRYGQGLDPNAVNKTATVASLQNSSMQARLKIYARNFAEQCLIPLFKGIMYLLGKHQTEALTIRLRNEFTAIDPRVWTTEYDMSVNVGLGTGTKQEQQGALMAIAQAQAAVGQTPFAQQLLNPKVVYNVQAKFTDLSGFKDPEMFWQNPDKAPPPEPQVPPEIQKAQMQIEADQQKHEAEMQMEAQKAQVEDQRKERELEMEAMFKRMEIMLEAQLEAFKTQLMAGVHERVGMAQAAMAPRMSSELRNGN